MLCPAALFQMGIVTILCDLTQPHPDVAIPPKAVNAAKRTEEGFAGNILCQPFVPAGQPPNIEKHIPKIVLVYLFKVRHLLTSLSRSLIRLRKTKNLTKNFVKNFELTTYLPILQDCRSAVFAVGGRFGYAVRGPSTIFTYASSFTFHRYWSSHSRLSIALRLQRLPPV